MSLATSNIFAALDTKKKKGSKSKEQDGKRKKKESKEERHAELERALFSQPQINVSSWGDVEDDDDFDTGLGPLPDAWAEVSCPTY